MFYFNNHDLVSEELLKLKVKELLLLLTKTDNLVSVRLLLKSLFSKTEFDFKTVIENNYLNPLSIEELAALCHLSLSSFKRKFVEIYNQPPARYIKKRRLEKAEELLSKTDETISEIAYSTGFSSISHFSRSFQEYYKTSPSEFRS